MLVVVGCWAQGPGLRPALQTPVGGQCTAPNQEAMAEVVAGVDLLSLVL